MVDPFRLVHSHLSRLLLLFFLVSIGSQPNSKSTTDIHILLIHLNRLVHFLFRRPSPQQVDPFPVSISLIGAAVWMMSLIGLEVLPPLGRKREPGEGLSPRRGSKSSH